MSIQLIQQYYAKVEQMLRCGGTRNESKLLGCVCAISFKTMEIVREIPE